MIKWIWENKNIFKLTNTRMFPFLFQRLTFNTIIMDFNFKATFLHFLKSLLFLMFTVDRLFAENIIRSTNLGSFLGTTNLVEFDKDYRYSTRFLGIPFAKAPVGEKRFARPEPLGNLTSLYNATFHRPHCIQTMSTFRYLRNFEQSEDCLYLNIYLPGHSRRYVKSYPVMIYIHGGSFAVGGADVYAGDKLSAFHQVIVVTINYRLNVFGFLSNGEISSGNYGLWDMKIAIQWVHDNIKDFGGDPSRVTLFGNSAGGAAVLYQAIYPDNRGLFQRVIAQSGSCFSHWAFQRNPVQNFKWYTARAGCVSTNFSEVIKCLRSKPIEILKLTNRDDFVPTVDSYFLPEDPVSLSKRHSEAGKAAMDFFSELDLLSGVASKDGATTYSYWSQRIKAESLGVYFHDKRADYYFSDFYITRRLSGIFDKITPTLVTSFIHQYTDWANQHDRETVRKKLIQFESDSSFFVPALYTAKKHLENGGKKRNNYFYVFHYKPNFVSKPEWLDGARHFMEVAYVFGFSESLDLKLIHDHDATDPIVVTHRDIKMARQLMTFWSNFAKTGSPNSPVHIADEKIPKWPVYDTKAQFYLEITSNMTSDAVKHHLAASRVAFWENVVPLLKPCSSRAVSLYPCFSCIVFELLLFVVCFHDSLLVTTMN